MMYQSKIPAQKLGFLAAICILCSLVEFAIPKPVPFLRLGLSNLPLLLALFLQFNLVDYFFLILIKICSQAWVSGSLFSYVFVLSFTGGITGGMAMYLVHKKENWFSFVGISVIGAFISNLFQILVATLFMGEKVLLLFPPMEAFGLVTSVLLGFIANYFVKNSTFLKFFKEVTLAEENNINSLKINKSHKSIGLVSLVVMLALFFTNKLYVVLGIFVYSIIFNLILKKKIRFLNIIFFILGITFINLLAPFGKVLYKVGTFNVTEGALNVGFIRAIKLQSTFFLSRLLLEFFNTLLKGRVNNFYLGRLISYQFFYFSKINEAWNKHQVKEKKIRAYLDRIDLVLTDSLKA